MIFRNPLRNYQIANSTKPDEISFVSRIMNCLIFLCENSLSLRTIRPLNINTSDDFKSRLSNSIERNQISDLEDNDGAVHT